MRDVALLTVFAAALPFVFRSPSLGAYLWACFSLASLHKFAFGFAHNFPFAEVIALTTLAALLLSRKRQPLPLNGVLGLQIALVVWVSFTSLFALAPTAAVLERWEYVMKTQLMLFVALMLVCDEKQLRNLIWVVTLSVAFFGIKGGVFTVLTGGAGRVWGPPGGFLQGNNELAAALVTLMPMLYFLRQTERNPWVRRGLLFAMLACGVSILGSQSRGALLALLTMAFFLGLKSRYPLQTSLALLVLVPLAVAFMPDVWSNRMETIRTYSADSSAMSRLYTWHTLWNAAVDRPLVGAGFHADTWAVFSRYAPQGGEWKTFQGTVLVAHSIYFQMLGEHGFVGLFLFLGLGIATWVSASRTAKASASIPEYAGWMPLLMRMVQVSLIGFGVGGAFLSLAYTDLPYYIVAFGVLSARLVKQRQGLPQALATEVSPHRPPLPGAQRPRAS